MEANHPGPRCRIIEIARDGVSDQRTQFLEAVGLGINPVAQGGGTVATFLRLGNLENDFGTHQLKTCPRQMGVSKGSALRGVNLDIDQQLLDTDELGRLSLALFFDSELDDLRHILEEFIDGSPLRVTAPELGRLTHVEAVLVFLDDHAKLAIHKTHSGTPATSVRQVFFVSFVPLWFNPGGDSHRWDWGAMGQAVRGKRRAERTGS